jgi:hypothetical protein
MILALQPLLFGLGFLTPLTAQIIDHAGVVPPFGLSPLMAGLVVGGVLGGVANLRGSWI